MEFGVVEFFDVEIFFFGDIGGDVVFFFGVYDV